MLTASQLLRQSCEELCQFFITHFDWISINLLYAYFYGLACTDDDTRVPGCPCRRYPDWCCDTERRVYYVDRYVARGACCSRSQEWQPGSIIYHKLPSDMKRLLHGMVLIGPAMPADSLSSRHLASQTGPAGTSQCLGVRGPAAPHPAQTADHAHGSERWRPHVRELSHTWLW